MKFSSLAALEIVQMVTSSAVSEDNFNKMMTFPFQQRIVSPAMIISHDIITIGCLCQVINIAYDVTGH